MANGKKSFVLYADLLDSIDHLTDKELGTLFRHILEYVNDLDPQLEDKTLLTAWKPIRRSLKQDLEKWEETRHKRSEAGRKGGLAKQANARSAKQTLANQAVSVSVSDSVSVSTKVDVDKFLSWFNNRKEHYTGKVGKFKTLSKTDTKNLKQLKEAYESEDFERALRGLYASEWAKEKKMYNPAHFLRVDNFNRYLESDAEPIQEEDDYTRTLRERGWVK